MCLRYTMANESMVARIRKGIMKAVSGVVFIVLLMMVSMQKNYAVEALVGEVYVPPPKAYELVSSLPKAETPKAEPEKLPEQPDCTCPSCTII